MKKVAYVTGSRAEYGIVKRLLQRLQQSPDIELSLLVTAMHLDIQYGNTVEIIENDGFIVKERFPINLNNQNNQMIIHSMAECLDQFGQHFQHNHYDAVIVLGDRYEMMAVATATAIHNIPLIHLHGGEQTLGNYDEFIRHCITKMAKLHLTSTEIYRQRVIQLGEHPQTVINIGSLGAENSLMLNLPAKAELLQQNKIPSSAYFVIVFHPETLNKQPVLEQVKILLKALDQFKHDFKFVFIGSNSDTSADKIFKCFQEYANKHQFHFFTSLKPEEYLALIKYSSGLIGNSSSGLLEAPSCGIGTVNIGDRQQGRVRGESVIDVAIDTESIIQAINKLISKDFQLKLPNIINPYYQENSMEKAYQAILTFLQENNSQQAKVFYDLESLC